MMMAAASPTRPKTRPIRASDVICIGLWDADAVGGRVVMVAAEVLVTLKAMREGSVVVVEVRKVEVADGGIVLRATVVGRVERTIVVGRAEILGVVVSLSTLTKVVVRYMWIAGMSIRNLVNARPCGRELERYILPLRGRLEIRTHLQELQPFI